MQVAQEVRYSRHNLGLVTWWARESWWQPGKIGVNESPPKGLPMSLTILDPSIPAYPDLHHRLEEIAQAQTSHGILQLAVAFTEALQAVMLLNHHVP